MIRGSVLFNFTKQAHHPLPARNCPLKLGRQSLSPRYAICLNKIAASPTNHVGRNPGSYLTPLDDMAPRVSDWRNSSEDDKDKYFHYVCGVALSMKALSVGAVCPPTLNSTRWDVLQLYLSLQTFYDIFLNRRSCATHYFCDRTMGLNPKGRGGGPKSFPLDLH